jgi:hypothetical protein
MCQYTPPAYRCVVCVEGGRGHPGHWVGQLYVSVHPARVQVGVWCVCGRAWGVGG